ncbi:hypothetical protein lerEdw1_005398 [Lerista edwardsae]|nr:hypothetical protein lerEdw1_005398 [Lerista edwardsae]
MQPPIVTMTDCSLFLCSFKQSKSAVRLKEDMKRIAAAPLGRPRGTSCRKVFGLSLQELQQQGLVKNGIPAVVWDIVEYLTRHGLKQEGLFRVNGSLKTVEQLRVKYESGEEVELATEGDVSSAASLLKLFLRELPDGVITSAVHPKFMQLYQDIRKHGLNANALRDLLRQLPEAHYCLLKYLCEFLRKVAEHHSENRMTLSNLATVFGPNCFHVSSGFEGMKEQEICNKIMAQMLENYSTLFEWEHPKKKNEKHPCEELAKIILVKEASCKQTLPIVLKDVERETPKPSPRIKLAKSKPEGSTLAVPQPRLSDGMPRVSIHVTDSVRSEEMDLADEISFVSSAAFFTRDHTLLFIIALGIAFGICRGKQLPYVIMWVCLKVSKAKLHFVSVRC